jgi:hypothetical protein
MGIQSTTLNVGFGTGDEESTELRQPIEPGEINIPPVHNIERARFRDQIIQDTFGIMYFAVGYLYVRW